MTPPEGSGAAPSSAATPIDASVPIDALPSPTVAPAEPAVGHIVVQNPIWCDIWIDGTLRGNLRNTRLEVAPGHHVVRCVNPAGEWTKETDVAPGAVRTLIGTVPDVAVTLEIDAAIDGKRYTRGSVVKLNPRRVEVIASGKRQFITFRTSCTLRDSPELDCYQ